MNHSIQILPDFPLTPSCCSSLQLFACTTINDSPVHAPQLPERYMGVLMEGRALSSESKYLSVKLPLSGLQTQQKRDARIQQHKEHLTHRFNCALFTEKTTIEPGKKQTTIFCIQQHFLPFSFPCHLCTSNTEITSIAAVVMT